MTRPRTRRTFTTQAEFHGRDEAANHPERDALDQRILCGLRIGLDLAHFAATLRGRYSEFPAP